MSIILFVIILAILILVHELGHFLLAKRAGVKVSEFGIGYPPFLFGIKRGETLYSVNALPFGGFVKIFGENPDEKSISGPEKDRSMVHKSRSTQAAILGGGVFFNIVFAWLLIAIGFMSGLPTPVSHTGVGIVEDPRLVITSVGNDSPAEIAGIKPGDVIQEVTAGNYILNDLSPELVSNFIEAHSSEEIEVVYTRGGEELISQVKPAEGIVPGKKVIGISMDEIGTLKLPAHLALIEAGKTTVNLLGAVVVGIVGFVAGAFTGQGGLSQITGPVGIVGLVGDVSALGWVYVLSFTAFISINLAIVNLLPFPALDGGRLLFLAIEGIKGSRINPKIANTLNAVGFVLLILLMVVVTIHDISKLI